MMRRCLAAGILALASGGLPAAELRAGILGLDTSPCITYSKLLDPAASDPVSGARFVAALKVGSPDVEKSASRVDGFATEMRDRSGVVICATIEEVMRRVDAVMILSGDGRTHLVRPRKGFPSRSPSSSTSPPRARSRTSPPRARSGT